jgi:hypothetical protein
MKSWQSTLLALAILGACCYGSMLVGVSIGQSVAESNFEGPRRDLGSALSELRTEIQKQNYQTVERKIDYLATNWYSIDFFRGDASPQRIPWYRFIHDYEAIDRQK